MSSSASRCAQLTSFGLVLDEPAPRLTPTRSIARNPKARDAARRGVETKRERTIARATETPIKLPTWSLDELARRALGHWHDRPRRDDRDWMHEDERYEPRLLSWDAADAFRDRICVNFLRHEASPYHDVLRVVVGRVGRQEARRIIFNRIVDAISLAYPPLASEAQRQYLTRFPAKEVA